MKKIIAFIGMAIFLFTALTTSVVGKDSEENGYDSINLSQEDINGIMAECQKLHGDISKTTNGKEHASSEMGYDIDLLLEQSGIVKIYRYDPRNDIISNANIGEVLAGAEKCYLIKRLNEENIYVSCDDADYKKHLYSFEKDFSRLCEYVLNGIGLFSKTNAYETLTDIEISRVYFVENPNGKWKPLAYPYRPSIMIYYVTNRGDFVYHCSSVEETYDEYLLPIEVYRELLVKQAELTEFYDMATDYDYNCLEGLSDIAEYWIRNSNDTRSIEKIKQENVSKYAFLSQDPNYLGYHNLYFIGKGMGFDKLSQFDKALKSAGYIGGIQLSGWVTETPFHYDFLEDMNASGYTTYAECRAALDAMIAANAPPAETQPTPTPAPSKLWHLAWIIPVAVIVPAAVIVPIIVTKKRKKKEE